MDWLPIIADMGIALLGSFCVWASVRYWQVDSHAAAVALVIGGLGLIAAGAVRFPSGALDALAHRMERDEAQDNEGDPTYSDDDSAHESGNRDIIIMGREDEVRKFLRGFIQDALVEVESNASTAAQTRIEVEMKEPTPTTVPSPEQTPAPATAPPKPARERTLPIEPTQGNAPSCTGFELLHGKSGGPEPDGCYAVGCQEGYALPMELVSGAWNACEKYSRLPRLDTCYIITDHDGSQRSMRFTKGSWKPGTCS